MLTKYGAILDIAEVGRFKKTASKFPWFVESNEVAMKRLAAVNPIMLNPDQFLYMRTRMVSAVEMHGPNANGDAFEHMELAAKYPTFINAAVNIDHDNDDPKKAVGIILDARYIPEQMYVEGVHAIDRERAEAKNPGIIAKIENGIVKDTSMGCYVEASICSHCLKEAGWDGKWDPRNHEKVARHIQALSRGHGIATVPEEYCRHIGKFGEKKGGLNGPYEINRGVNFFEDSIITTTGADKDAKYIGKIASKNPEWMRHLVHRVIVNGGITTANLILKGDETMADPLKKVVAEEGSKLNEKDQVSVEDKGNYSEAEDKDKDLFNESKEKSEKSKGMGGSQVSSAEEREDYALASLQAIATVKQLAKKDPEGVRAMLFSKEAEEKEDDKKEDKKEAAVKPGEKEAKKKPSLVARIVGILEAAMSGNQVDTMEEKPDYGSGADKLKEQFSESVEKSESTPGGMRGSQLQSAEEKPDYPLQKRGSKKEADDTFPPKKEPEAVPAVVPPAAEKKDDMLPKKEGEEPRSMTQEDKDEKSSQTTAVLVERLAAGETLEQARQSVAKVEQDNSRSARRKRLADDMNHGSMGSEGLPEKDGDDAPVEKLKDFHEKVEAPASKKLETMEEKAVGAGVKKADVTNVEKKIDDGNKETLDTEQIRKDNGRKVGSKKEAEDSDEHKSDEAPESPTAKTMTAPHGVEREGSWGSGWKDIKTVKEGTVLVWAEDSAENAKKLVDNMDEKEAVLHELIGIKAERAEVLAKAGYKRDAAEHLNGIAVLEAHATNIVKIANGIFNLVFAIDKLDPKQASLKEASTLRVLALVKEADEELKDTKKSLDDMKPGDMKKEESYAVAKKMAEKDELNKTLQANLQKTQQKVASMVKTRVVSEVLKLGMQKGIVTASNRDRMIQKLSNMPEVQFEATRTAWLDLPDMGSKKEASELIPASMGTLTPKKVEASVEEDSLDGGNFFGKY